jgi:hypothetical protein
MKYTNLSNTVFLFFIACFFFLREARSQDKLFQTNEWHFNLYGNLYLGKKLSVNQAGYAEISVLNTGGYKMAVANRRHLSATYFGEAKIAYGRAWTGFKTNFDFTDFFQNIGESFIGVKPNLTKLYDREYLSLVLSAGAKQKLTKKIDSDLRIGIAINHFLSAQIENRTYFGNTNFNQLLPYLQTNIKLPGGKEKHLNNRSYLMPGLEIEGSITFNNSNLRAFSINLGFSCFCLTEEGEGTMEFTYFNNIGNKTGSTIYKSRLMSINAGIGYSF